ncbi:MAG: cobalamin-dependent protein [Acidimicrobiia bacterium]|jgi:methanogenic corrinoid protein MtbC1
MSSQERDASAIELGITSAAITGDAGTLYRVASKLMDEGVTFDALLFDYLLPAERAVGHRWQQGDYLISEEHAATAAIETVIALFAGMFDQPEGAAHVVIAAAQGDDHSLPGRAISAHLLYNGYRTTFLGANVLATDLAEFLEAETPDALVLSCTMSSHLVGAHASIGAARRAGVPVVVGGRAFGKDDSRARKLGADAWSATLQGVQGELDALIADGVTGAPVAMSPQLEDLLAEEIEVLADAHAHLRDSEDVRTDRRWLDEIAILLGAVEGVMLTGDDDVLGETLRWQQAIMTSHGYRPDLVADSLRVALAERSPAAAKVLERSLGGG